MSEDARGFRIKMNAGIAGHVSTTGESLNIGDAYLDPRFNQVRVILAVCFVWVGGFGWVFMCVLSINVSSEQLLSVWWSYAFSSRSTCLLIELGV